MSQPARILVVDDNEDNRYTLKRRLRREGYDNVAIATNGREALELIASQRFDLAACRAFGRFRLGSVDIRSEHVGATSCL
jgi:CheY-like chemotaxis protein